MLFTNTYSGLITGGLGFDALQGLITASYHVGPITIIIVVQPLIPGGGPYPKEGAWNVVPTGKIQDFYKPVNPAILENNAQNPPFYLPVAAPRNHVTVRVMWDGKPYEKEYLVRQKTTKIIVNTLNFVNKLFQRGNVLISNFKRLPTSIKVKIKNIIRRKSHK